MSWLVDRRVVAAGRPVRHVTIQCDLQFCQIAASREMTPQLTPALTSTVFSEGQGLSANGNAQADGPTIQACSKALRASTLGMERASLSSDVINGAGGIRTPGAFRPNGFQDRRLKPLGHCSKSTRKHVPASSRLLYPRQVHTARRWLIRF